jgi:hypothetical protein
MSSMYWHRRLPRNADGVMAHVPVDTDEESLADWDEKSTYWENEARNSPPDIAAVCLDYAQHISNNGLAATSVVVVQATAAITEADDTDAGLVAIAARLM